MPTLSQEARWFGEFTARAAIGMIAFLAIMTKFPPSGWPILAGLAVAVAISAWPMFSRFDEKMVPCLIGGSILGWFIGAGVFLKFF